LRTIAGTAALAALLVAFPLRAGEVIVASQSCAATVCQAEAGAYTPTGEPLRSSTFESARQEYVTDMALDADQNLYLLDQVRGRIFDRELEPKGRLSGRKELLNTITFDASGNAYVGVFNLTKRRLRKFDSRGMMVAEYKTPFTVYSADLASDQCTLYYIADPRGPQIVHRYNVCAKSALSDFGRISAPNVIQIRLLPDGGILVAGHSEVQRYAATGQLIKSYDLAGSDYWRSISITADRESFWAATRREIVRFDLTTGESREQFVTPFEETTGVVASDEWRAASSTPGRPLSPIDLVATLTPEARIQLQWTDRASDEKGFSLEYQVRDEGWKPLGDVGANVTGVIVTVPNNVLVYSFRLRAFNDLGASGYSNIASVPEPEYQDF
jgi:hypothetical protein